MKRFILFCPVMKGDILCCVEYFPIFISSLTSLNSPRPSCICSLIAREKTIAFTRPE